MPLTRRVLEWTAGLDRALRDPSVAVIDVPVPPENEAMIARILTGWARQVGSMVLVGVDVSSPDRFVEALALELRAIVEALVQSADAAVGAPPDLDAMRDPRAVLEAAERVALWAAPWARPLVLVVRAREQGVPEWLWAAASRGGALTKWLVLRDERVSLGLEGERWSRRAAARLSPDVREARAQIGALRRGEIAVLTCEGPPLSMRRFLTAEGLDALHESEVIGVSSPFAHARASAWVALEAMGEVGRGDPIDALALALDRRARARPTLLLLTIESPERPAVDLAELGDALAARVMRPGLRVVIVGDGVSGASPVARVLAHPLRIDALAIEAGMRERLEGECTLAERCRFDAGLASMLAARGEHEEAILRAERAVRCAMSSPSPTALLVPCLMTLGSVLSHAERVAEALDVLARCAVLALASDEPVVVGRAITSMAHLYARADRLDDAIRCYRVGADVARRAGDDAGCDHARTWLAEARRRAGDEEGAVTILADVVTSSSGLPAPDALFVSARGEAAARLAQMLDHAGLRARAEAYSVIAHEAGHTGPLCGCPYP